MRVKRLFILAMPAIACGIILLLPKITAARHHALYYRAEAECLRANLGCTSHLSDCMMTKTELDVLLDAVKASKLSRREARVQEYQTRQGPLSLPLGNDECVEAILDWAGK